MYLEENKELADGMNHLEIRLGDHGYVQVDRTWHSEQVCSPFSRLYLVRRGEGLLRVGGNSLTMRPGFAYWIPAGLCFDYLCENTMEKLFFHVQALKPDGYDLLMGMGRVETRPLPPESWIACWPFTAGGIMGRPSCSRPRLRRSRRTWRRAARWRSRSSGTIPPPWRTPSGISAVTCRCSCLSGSWPDGCI